MSRAGDLRRKRLLEAGYFPAELPPPFTTRSFASHSQGLLKEIDVKDIYGFWSIPESFGIPRWGQMRRKLSIVNPINQLLVTELIAQNWGPIRGRLITSKTSEFHPEIVSRGGRAVTGVNFNGVRERRAQILANYGRYIKTDVARFYASIYTHSIPWAILGKVTAKKMLKEKNLKGHFSDQLDAAVRAGQAGQTIGLPIGPDTSRILSELVACAFEDITRTGLPSYDDRSVRYVDDMIIGLQDNETTHGVLAKLSAGLYEFELEINGEKTSCSWSR